MPLIESDQKQTKKKNTHTHTHTVTHTHTHTHTQTNKLSTELSGNFMYVFFSTPKRDDPPININIFLTPTQSRDNRPNLFM